MKTQEDRRMVELALALIEIVDEEKRFVRHDDETRDTEELRMQIREVAFVLMRGGQVTREMLS